MKTFDLKGTLRKELGKKATKKVRKEDSIPCVLYGIGEPIHFIANEKEYGKVIYTASSYQINLDIDGTVYPAIMREIQFHPVSDRPIHIDFIRIADGKPVIVSIPVRLEGFAKGVQQGGKLKLEMRRVTVKGIIDTIPDELLLDVTNIEVGQSIKVRDLSYPEFEILDPKNAVLASVKTTRVAKGAAEVATAAPEVK
ncbi:MAG: 50S ribosomal protein L25/general stress protein Ctc [Bacteroidales bacterium]|jgi:large subunit ribosomal protein L25